jgi:glycosyltransferase involved in cell wall biosynthesis
MKFSIITSLYRPYELLERCLASVIDQTHTDWEWIIISDGPMPDESHRLINKHTSRFPRKNQIIPTEQPHGGWWGNKARNKAMDLCTGEYVCWVNHDNIIYPDYLARHNAMAEARGKKVITVVPIQCRANGELFDWLPRLPLRHRYIDLLNFAMPLALARECNAFGGVDAETYAADWALFDRAQKKAAPVIDVSEVSAGVHF